MSEKWYDTEGADDGWVNPTASKMDDNGPTVIYAKIVRDGAAASDTLAGTGSIEEPQVVFQVGLPESLEDIGITGFSVHYTTPTQATVEIPDKTPERRDVINVTVRLPIEAILIAALVVYLLWSRGKGRKDQ